MFAPKLNVFAKHSVPSFPATTPPSPRPPPHLSLMADKCTSMDELKQIHAQMIVSSVIHDNFAASRLLSFCAVSNSGDRNYALNLFNNTPNPNTFMWNTIIRSQASTSNPSQALILYVKMRRAGATPGKHTYPFLLKACSNYRSIHCCKQVHNHLLKFGLDLDLHVVNGLVRCYSVSNDLSNARKVFDEMPEKNLSIWTTMICGYAQNLQSNEALTLFDRMVINGFEPNGVTLSSVLSACATSGCLELGERIHFYIKERDIEVSVVLETALVHMYAKNGAISIARDLFNAMREKNIATWNAMIGGLAVHGHGKEALELFQEMVKERVVPNSITFVGVLSACCHAGLVDVGRKFFNSMRRLYNVEPRIEHFGCFADLLGRDGRLDEAEELIKGMAWKADVMIWGALLGACRNHGNVEVAERVVKEILILEPNNHGVYVVLSNMYAEAGRWEDVLRMRKVMRKGNLKKTRGWSAVDGDASKGFMLYS